MRNPILTCCALLLGSLLPVLAGANELYRYTDDKGTTVLSRQGVPPEYIGRGYEVLNSQGRVVRVVPPAPSAEEMQELLAEKARAKNDGQLLRLYSNPDDVERARERKMSELDGLIGVARGNLQAAQVHQSNLQSQAAEHERAGRQVPEHLLAQIENQKAEQERLKADIERYRQARQEADAAFDADRDRLKVLLDRRQ